jgi:hypothetical protein
MLGRECGFGRKYRRILLSPLVAFALLTAPTVGAIQSACDQCPPTCPMHRTVKPKRDKPSCHNQESMGMRHEEKAEKQQGPTFSRPPCGHSGIVPGVAMGPMVLSQGTWIRLQPPIDRFHSLLQRLRARFAEPPTTPPPIVAS